jgi:hypothetical protein
MNSATLGLLQQLVAAVRDAQHGNEPAVSEQEVE